MEVHRARFFPVSLPFFLQGSTSMLAAGRVPGVPNCLGQHQGAPGAAVGRRLARDGGRRLLVAAWSQVFVVMRPWQESGLQIRKTIIEMLTIQTYGRGFRTIRQGSPHLKAKTALNRRQPLAKAGSITARNRIGSSPYPEPATWPSEHRPGMPTQD